MPKIKTLLYGSLPKTEDACIEQIINRDVFSASYKIIKEIARRKQGIKRKGFDRNKTIKLLQMLGKCKNVGFYKCYMCNDEFYGEEIFRAHMLDVHNKYIAKCGSLD